MLFSESKVRIKDNSGAIWVKCIKILNSSKKKGIKPLGISVVSIRKIKLNKNRIEKGKIYKAVLIRGKKNFERRNGDFISFDSNSLILLNEKSLPIPSRIKGPIYKEFRSKFLTRFLILSNFAI